MLLTLLLLLLSCDASLETKRANNARKSRELKIGVAWTSSEANGMLIEGVKLALEEYNGSLPLGKTLKLEIRDDEGSINKGITNAANFIQDLNTIAVIGHTESYISVPASALYEFNGILMISPYSTAAELLENGYSYIFRSIPSDESLSEELVDYFVKQGLSKINLCYLSNTYGLSFANAFEKRAEAEGLDITDRVSYDVGDLREFNKIVKKWENYDYDSIMFVGTMPEGVNFYRVLAQRGIDLPVVNGEAMIDRAVLSEDRAVVEGKVLPSLFHHDDSSARSFVSKFNKKYGKDPDAYAALGYDSMKLIIDAIIRGKSYAPRDIAINLRKLKDYKGVANTYNFNEKGDLISKGEIGIQEIKDSKFEYMGRF